MNPPTFFAKLLGLGLLAVFCGNAIAASACNFKYAFTRSDSGGTTTVKVYEAQGVTLSNGKHPFLFISSLKINTDGTTISYHQDDPTGRRCVADPTATACAINNIRNAYNDPAKPESDFEDLRKKGYPLPATWKLLSGDIIEKDKSTGKPCITSNGYLVSMTADVAVAGGQSRVGDCDPTKWIDALTSPAIVLPKTTRSSPSQFSNNGIKMRSLVVAVSGDPSHQTVPGIVGDLGPVNELGEANVAMNQALNGLPAADLPKHRKDAVARFQVKKAAVLLFPGSEFILDYPIDGPRISTEGNNALSTFGGAAKLVKCIQEDIDKRF